jgi:hypothetical protein
MKHLFHIPVILLVAGILWLPVFPSQDGPLHLYYAGVEQAVEADPSAYGGEFLLKPARLFYTFANRFFELMSPLEPETAEKLLAILCIVGFCYGFRYLATAAGGANNPALLLIFPFVFHTALFRGFYNYNAGLALMLCTCGFWLRYSGRLGGWRSGVFALLILLHLTTHPIPLLLAAMFAGAEVAVSIWQDGLRHQRRRLLHVGAMFAAVLFVALRVSAGSGAEIAVRFHPVPERIIRLARLIPLLPFDSWLLWACGVLSAGAMVALATLAWRSGEQRWRLGLLLLFGLGGLASPLTVPWGFGPLANIDERFPIVGAAFLCAAAASSTVRWPRTVAAGALIIGIVAIGVNLRESRSIAETAAALVDAPPTPAGIRGVLVAPAGPATFPPGARFAACQWVAASYFRRSKAVLINFAWLDQAQHRLQPANPGPLSFLDPQAAGAVLDSGKAQSGFDLIVTVNCRDTGPSFDVAANRLGFTTADWSTPQFSFYLRK